MSDEKKGLLKSTKDEKKIFRKIFWRSANLLFVPSFSKQQGTTYSWVMLPFLEKIYGKDSEELYDRMKEHQAFFNITAAMAPFVIGLNVSMEEENKRFDTFDPTSIQAMKASLMGPLSGIGDAIFWGTLRVIATSIALGLSLNGNLLGPILFLLIFNIPNLIVRYYGALLGYKIGNTYISQMMSNGTFQIITKAFSILGLLMVGAMSAQFVKLESTLVTELAGQEFNLQEILDSIMPRLLPLILTIGSFVYMRKKNKPIRLMLAIFAIAIVLTLLGITG
ncbi:PTS system mannose/fructose/sorbose family transporter subunit IID [Enterococcus sp. DIV0240d]|uniref:PTS system mannose/fructose/sorbose family transporter subunit IID n=1 Tax=Enterococcus sp. DIV0240d TaxID=2774717 RepID=UPI003F247C50